MSLNHIQLNSSMLANMYRHSLVESNEVQQGEEKKNTDPLATGKEIKPNDAFIEKPVDLEDTGRHPERGWKYLGENRKNFLLIVCYNDVTYLPDQQLNFLTSILGACKLSLGDVAILNISNSPSRLYTDVQEKFKSSATILFGITPLEFEMPVNFPEFQVQPFNNCIFLHTPSLEKLESDKVLKSKLWVCLRKIFGV